MFENDEKGQLGEHSAPEKISFLEFLLDQNSPSLDGLDLKRDKSPMRECE